MDIDRDQDSERQTRVDHMINEFRQAQSRRTARLTDKAVELKPEAGATMPPAGSIAVP
ncbi:MAG TPA: hypothetical protein VL173_13685 [Vicinamibacterales bacterium]|jgi:hypothetical protein|nr:hypothetical protein [Vicinamibacterales bacterium]